MNRVGEYRAREGMAMMMYANPRSWIEDICVK